MTIAETLMTAHRIEITRKEDFSDPANQKVLKSIRDFLRIPVEEVQLSKVYTIMKELTPEQLDYIAAHLLIDPIVEKIDMITSCDCIVEVGLKPGVTDNVGKTAQLTIEDFLEEKFREGESVSFSIKYRFKGKVDEKDARRIADLLANPLIENVSIGESLAHRTGFVPSPPPEISKIILPKDEQALLKLSRDMGLALNIQEMRTIRDYFVEAGRDPTDVEIEILAQTWSEHCKHKIFNATINYNEDGKREVIKSLFKTYIKRATEEIGKEFLVSVFTDNAGIIKFNDEYNIAFKVETHNSPSALDPYGGALTGILGVNRDILGAGMGARLLANTDVFCFAPEDYEKEIPRRLLHPKRISEGVRLGVEHGGNKSGVPTVNGAIVYHDNFLGKPLVYCGSLGLIPSRIQGKESHIKDIAPGDQIVIAGGRTGKDGIHGATFSSEELHAESPSSAVQIGDPFTQKKVHDFLIEARDNGLYRTVTDNGAGGFSSSVGELAALSGGCEMHLDKALLKYPGLAPWEIMVSESQERMTFAVPPENVEAMLRLAEFHEVEAFVLGTFTNSGYLQAYYEGVLCANLQLAFLHDGVPTLNLEAEWLPPKMEVTSAIPDITMTEVLLRILARDNVCSKENVIRQYDHEVQGGSVVKPLVGDGGPSDAAVIRPIECYAGKEGIVISNGICPKFSALDTYHMAINAVDEAIRNSIAVGCDPDSIAILDNFCWPDPIFDPVKTPDGKYKLAQLVRANKGLYEASKAFEVPIISGKDSMKNDYKIGEVKISIPPTLLISALGKIPDIHKAVTMDVKFPEDLIYIVGLTKCELGGTEFAEEYKIRGMVPKVDLISAKEVYKKIFSAMQDCLIASCHDCSDGGIAAALAETGLAGGLGIEVDLKKIPQEGCFSPAEILFSETPSRFVITISKHNQERFERALEGIVFSLVGQVRSDQRFYIAGHIDTDIITINKSWRTKCVER